MVHRFGFTFRSACGMQSARGMATAHTHEELVVWQLAQELKLGVYKPLKTRGISRDFELRDQLRRSGASAPRNIAEGFGRFLPGQFIHYLRIANGSLNETFDALGDGCDRGHFTREEVIPLQRLAQRASKATGSLISYLKHAEPPDRPRRDPMNPVQRFK
jgi:four helix bundle protein